MTIYTGAAITAADLNTLYDSSLQNLRSLNRTADSTNTYIYTFMNVNSGTTAANILKQTINLVPPTDLYLKEVFLEVSNSQTGVTYTVTISGSDLIVPISVSVAGSGGTIQTNSYSPSTNNAFQTLFAGSRYTINLTANTVVTNRCYVTLVVNHGYRR